ncbi:MAG: hypothetical protein HGA97_02640 [Chlorobiaceae bacterium]|jgi:hypothetical protein|nr:hypothetical protein [Chlorobiaceae bacterium]
MAELESIFRKLMPRPLKGDEIDKWYVDSTAGRSEGYEPAETLKRRLLAAPDGKLQILFSGYRGCGKSTELNRMARQIADRMLVLNYSIRELDPITLNHVELFVLAMEKLFGLSQDYGLGISRELLDSVNSWRRSTEIEKIIEVIGDLGIEAGAEAQVTVPFMTKFFAKLRTTAKVGGSSKRKIVETIEPKLNDLIIHCNDLIREIRLHLSDIGKEGLVIIIEDMDKLSVEKAEELFFNHSTVLTSLETNVVFTFPVSLKHHNRAKIVIDNFKPVFELPMVKVHDKEGNPFEKGRETLRRIVEQRIGNECFESEALLYWLIDLSGGCIIDLFRLISDAADIALNNRREKIGDSDCRKSFYLLRRDYDNTIAEKRIDNKLVVSVGEYFDVLKQLASDGTKKVENTEAALDLRQNLCILSYNDEGWCDVHPVVRSILKDRQLI